ncbi:hypothetical protein ACIA8O_06665 [Kitasatospora sp. NPDC051853]|uniref:hypothetical protein n=1 Tax=Kitasatospora sp. NPDC051853 TaxID=3364058 RepID=UPI003794E5C7
MERHLVLGDVSHQFAVAPAPERVLVVAGLAAAPEDGGRAMEVLRRPLAAAGPVTVADPDGGVRAALDPGEPVELWAAGLAPALAELLRGQGVTELRSLAPLLVLRTHRSAERPWTEVLMCARVRAQDTVFVRVARFEHPADAPAATLAARGLEHAGQLHQYVRVERYANHQYEQGTEIEHKVTLRDEVSIWDVALHLWRAVEAGEFPGYVTDPGYELTRWQYDQHNWDVTGPEGQGGHLSLQLTPYGTYTLKRKVFQQDTLRREQIIVRGVEIPDGDLEGHLRRAYPELEIRPLPALTRARFDLNVQSLVTGNYFGIETDEVTVHGLPGTVLRQVETEYLHTRRHEGMDQADVDADMAELAVLIERHLAGRGIKAEAGHLSKLAFLRGLAGGES